MSLYFHTTPHPEAATTDDYVTIGHDTVDGSIKTGSGKLILSASNAIVHISGALDFGLNVENQAYHIRAKNTHLILSSSVGSFVYTSGNLTVSQELLVKGDSVLSGNVVVGGQVYDLNSNLILSSAVGSVIAASGSLDFPQTDKTYHIRAVNSHLILSSSTGSRITVSGSLHLANFGSLLLDTDANTFIDGGGVDNTIVFYTNNSQRANISNNGLSMAAGRTVVVSNGPIYDSSGFFILSSSVGSVVAMSSSLNFPNSDKDYHIRAVNSHLILTSSGGSKITVSGSLLVTDLSSIITRGTIYNDVGNLILSSSVGSVVALSGALQFSTEASSLSGHITAKNSNLILSSSVGSSVIFSASTIAMKVAGNGNAGSITWNDSAQMGINAAGGFSLNNAGTLGGTSWTVSGFLSVAGTANSSVRASLQHLILSSAAGSVTSISGALDLNQTNQAYHVRTNNSDLVLSSSAGSLTTNSGSFRSTGYASASLPNPTLVRSGTITYVNDLGFLALAWDGTWQRIVTGSF